jgi:four helix bundle protein
MKSEEDKRKIRKFTDLKVWQEARLLAKLTYEMTRKFPLEERFGLISQMQRASVSVPSNIAEGFRRDTMKDKVRFYVQAHGSLTELQNQFIICNDVGIIDDKSKENMLHQADKVDALLSGIIRSSKEKI